MKLTVVSFLILCTVASAIGQDYKRFRIAIGGGLALPQGSNGTPGWVASIEPGFRLTNNLLIGLKGETGMFARGMSRNLTVVNPATQIISGTFFTQLYISTNYVRPFFAGGVGYSLLSDEHLRVTFNGASGTLTIGEDQVHFMVRAGIEVWHLSASAEVTFSGDEKPTDFLEISNSYLTFRLMFLIGGGLQ